MPSLARSNTISSENIADFNDALNTLRGSLSYLYSNTAGDRYWYDTRPTLRKTAQDRATQMAESDVEYEIETRLRKLRKEEPFAGLHICPASSLDVTDEQAVRLVILRTDAVYRVNNEKSPAIEVATDILNNRGTSPRIYRNMLAFIAPDQELMQSLKVAVREFLAWKSILDDKEVLNLDVAQNKEVDNNIRRSTETVEVRIKETYCWLLAPYIDRAVDMRTIQWESDRISGGTDSIVSKASRCMQQQEQLITKWAPALLLMELDDILWKESNFIQIKKLWEYLCTYCYLPRLADYSVLEDAIQKGVNSSEYFALAAGYSNERYIDLKFDEYVDSIQTSDYLVKKLPALEQIAADHRKASEQSTTQGNVAPLNPDVGHFEGTGVQTPNNSGMSDATEPATGVMPSKPQNTRFFMSATLDNTRINRDVQRLVEEVINHLINTDGCNVEVTLEVNAVAADGLPTPIVRTITENCKTLKVKNFGVDN